ncbi:MAG: SPOR domain-containing protein [Draconibacterium sp.]
MKLGNYIHELLKENETVIIPGFGAFLSDYQPAVLEGDEVRPPSREITFTHQIRNNDGLLVGYIADTEKISHFDALKIIERERENIIFLLDKGEEIELEETGVLFMDEKNEIRFNPFYDENLLLDSFGLEPVSITEVQEEEKLAEVTQPEEIQEPEIQKEIIEEETAEHITSEEEQTEEEQIIEPEQIIEENPEIDESENLQEEISAEANEANSATEEPEIEKSVSEEGRVIETEPAIEKITDLKENEEPAEEPVVAEEITEDTVIPEPEPKPEKAHVLVHESVPEEKKKRSGLWYLLILIPVIVAGVFIFKNQNKQAKNNPITTKETSVPEQKTTPGIRNMEVTADSTPNNIAEEQITDSVQTTQPQPENVESLNSDTPKFYLVGGGFKEEENAEIYITELKAKGLNAFHIGKKGNYFMVGIGVYKTEGEAVRARREYTEDYPESGAWILEEK